MQKIITAYNKTTVQDISDARTRSEKPTKEITPTLSRQKWHIYVLTCWERQQWNKTVLTNDDTAYCQPWHCMGL